MVKFKRWLSNPFILASILTSCLLYSGFLKPEDSCTLKSMVLPEDAVCLSGMVSSNPSRTSSGKYYSMALNARKAVSGKRKGFVSSAEGTVQLLVPSSQVEALYPGKLYSSSGQKGTVYEKGLIIECSVSHIGGNLYISENGINAGPENSFVYRLYEIRSRCRILFKRLLFSWGKAGALILSLLSGSREYLEEGLTEKFSIAGLSHILALSGMHLSFFSALADSAGRKIGGKRISFYMKLSAIIFFVWFAGLSPSLYRALLCSIISLVLSAMYIRNCDYTAVLSAAFLIHCATRPEDIFTPAFLLSYGALAGILLAGDFLKPLFSGLIPGKINESFCSSIAAQTFTMPVCASLFSCIAPVGIVASVFTSPLISIFMFLSVTGIVFSLFFPFLSPLFGAILNLCYGGITFLVSIFSAVPPIEFTGA